MKKISASTMELFKYKMLLLGMVNILAVSAMAGILGAGYLGVSLAILLLFLSLHSLWLSGMVTKYVKGRNARGQYKSSLKFFRGALLYVLVTGVLLCALFLLFNSQIGAFFIRDIHISICLIPIAVMFLIYGLSEVISGYLQGMNFYLPVKIFYLVRQITGFVGSVAGMKFLGEYGQKVAKLKHNEAIISVYSAFGSLLGMLAGAFTGLILLLVFCMMLRGEFHMMRGKDNARFQESAFHGFQVMLSLGILQGIRYAMLLAPLPLNYILYVRLCMGDGDSAPWIRIGGYLFGEAVPVITLPIVIFTILNHKNFRQLSGHWKNEAYAQFRAKLFAMFFGVVTLALPVCFGIAVMAEPILQCLVKGASKEGAAVFLYTAVGAVVLLLEMMALRLMELWNETLYLYLTVVVSFTAQTVFSVLAFKVFDLKSAGIVLGMIVQAVIILVMFFARFAKRLRFSGIQLKKLVMALILALAGAVVILLIYQLAGSKLPAGAAAAVSMIPGFALYLAAVTLLRIVNDQEAELMPGGELFFLLNGLLRR